MRAMKRLSESQIIRFFQKQNSKEFVAEDVEIFLLGKRNCATSIDTLVPVSYTHLTLPTKA